MIALRSFLPIFIAATATAAPVYTLLYDVTDLGALGGSTSVAYALSPNGQVVGMATTLFGNMQAVDFGLSGITDLTAHSGAAQGIARGVNNAGQISGTEWIGNQSYATVWNNDSVQTIGGAGSYGEAIDAQGDIAGMLIANGQGHAFVTQNGVVHDLGTLPGGNWSSAYAMNNSGDVAGYGSTGATMTAFVWSPALGYTLLGTLGGGNAFATAINQSGAVAGQTQNSTGFLHAAMWTGGSVHDLGTLGGSASFAYGLNDGGDAVGYSLTAGNTQTHAFFFDGTQMLDLNNLLISGSGWTLTQAYAINDAGQIAGTGLFNGVEQAFLLTPEASQPPGGFTPTGGSGFAPAVPEPPTWRYMLLGLSGLALRYFRWPFPPLRRRRDRQPRLAGSNAAP